MIRTPRAVSRISLAVAPVTSQIGYLPELKLAGSGSIFLAVTVVDNLCPFFLETELEPPCTRCVCVGRKMVEEIDLVFDLNEGSLQTS